MKNLRAFMEDQGFSRVPLKKINTNHFEIKATVNGISGKFILDTGASNSCIGTDSVAHFNIKATDSQVKAAGAGAVGMVTQVAEDCPLQIGAWKKRNISFVVFDLSHVNEALDLAKAKAVHGIIGADVLKTARAVIDYGRNCMYLKTQK